MPFLNVKGNQGTLRDGIERFSAEYLDGQMPTVPSRGRVALGRSASAVLPDAASSSRSISVRINMAISAC
jgi:hypothetical protein